MSKYRKIMPTIEVIPITEVLYGFKHNFPGLPKWVQEAYNTLSVK